MGTKKLWSSLHNRTNIINYIKNLTINIANKCLNLANYQMIYTSIFIKQYISLFELCLKFLYLQNFKNEIIIIKNVKYYLNVYIGNFYGDIIVGIIFLILYINYGYLNKSLN